LVNILLDNPMTQFSFEWILSLNWLCQKWGQVQAASSVGEQVHRTCNQVGLYHGSSIVSFASR
jgi:hypothetical protein